MHIPWGGTGLCLTYHYFSFLASFPLFLYLFTSLISNYLSLLFETQGSPKTFPTNKRGETRRGFCTPEGPTRFYSVSIWISAVTLFRKNRNKWTLKHMSCYSWGMWLCRAFSSLGRQEDTPAPCPSPLPEASVALEQGCCEYGYFEELVPAAWEMSGGSVPVTFSSLVMLSSFLAQSPLAVYLYLSAVCIWLYSL